MISNIVIDIVDADNIKVLPIIVLTTPSVCFIKKYVTRHIKKDIKLTTHKIENSKIVIYLHSPATSNLLKSFLNDFLL